MVRYSFLTVAALNGLAAALPGQNRHKNDAWKSNIKNVVVLVEENRSYDTFLGGLTHRGDLDGLVGKTYCNPMYVSSSQYTSPTEVRLHLRI